jgi:hypothetical protein
MISVDPTVVPLMHAFKITICKSQHRTEQRALNASCKRKSYPDYIGKRRRPRQVFGGFPRCHRTATPRDQPQAAYVGHLRLRRVHRRDIPIGISVGSSS